MFSPPSSTSALLETPVHIHHGFFGRQGGVSTGDFTSLNCSQFSGDSNESINTNRKRVADSLGGTWIFSNRQVHSNRVRVVDGESSTDEVFEGDGLVTREAGLCLGILGADCAPVLFADPDEDIIGAAHAGWKGALLGVTDTVIDKMTELGARRSRILCAIGPAIQVESYQVGPEFVVRLQADSPVQCDDCFRRDDADASYYFDLPQYVRKRVMLAGIESLDVLPDDTCQDENRFFSYRRSCHRGDTNYGRQIGVIMLGNA
jgi:YfiH family protein